MNDTNNSQEQFKGKMANDGKSYLGETELQTAIRRWG